MDAPPVEGAAERPVMSFSASSRVAPPRSRASRGRVPEPIISGACRTGAAVPGDVLVEDAVRRRHVAVHVVVYVASDNKPVGRVVADSPTSREQPRSTSGLGMTSDGVRGAGG